jgi:hypothetical protein
MAVVGEPDAAVALMASAPDAGEAGTDAASEALAATDEVDAALEEADAGAAVAVVTVPRIPSPPIRPRPSGPPRRVVFDINPGPVSVGVDGATPRSVGVVPWVELSPIPHVFRIVAAEIGGVTCCRPATVPVDLSQGEGEFRLTHRLESADARLYVYANVPADVVVSGGRVGPKRTSELILVPITEPERWAEVSITVTAPGFREYTRTDVRLDAGADQRVTVVLQPATPTEGGESPHE